MLNFKRIRNRDLSNLHQKPFSRQLARWTVRAMGVALLVQTVAPVTLAQVADVTEDIIQDLGFEAPTATNEDVESSTANENSSGDEAPAPPIAISPITAKVLWTRMEEGMAFNGCHGFGHKRYSKTLGANEAQLMQQLSAVIEPFEFVLHELERNQLPSEFAFLPMVESGYRLVEGKGQQPAGVWQLVPITAKDLGLQIDGTTDERLSLPRSTNTAIRLLKNLQRSFPDDWRLVVMAYNAGEFRVRNAIREAGSRDPAKLKVSAITQQHLAKLNAWACLIKHTRYFKRDADEVLIEDPWRALELPTSIHRSIPELVLEIEPTADVSGMDADQSKTLPNLTRFKALNHPKLVTSLSWLVPAGLHLKIQQLMPHLGTHAASPWMTKDDLTALNLDALSEQLQLDLVAIQTLLQSNRDGENAATIWLPMIETQSSATATMQDSASSQMKTQHQVQAGETVWTIARRYRVRVADLLRWNALSKRGLIRPGQILKLSQP